jgi:hypothetical protein
MCWQSVRAASSVAKHDGFISKVLLKRLNVGFFGS